MSRSRAIVLKGGGEKVGHEQTTISAISDTFGYYYSLALSAYL